jgi:hypothetical protein
MATPDFVREPTMIDDTVIMENPGQWEGIEGDYDVGYEGPTASDSRPVVVPPLAA